MNNTWSGCSVNGRVSIGKDSAATEEEEEEEDERD
jgi:hypothetical protein